MDAKRTGSFIAEMRKQNNMTQAELAAKLQVTDKAVSRWERGVGYPDITLLEPLAGQLGVTVLDILRGERTSPEKMSGEETEPPCCSGVFSGEWSNRVPWRSLRGQTGLRQSLWPGRWIRFSP